MSELIIFEGEGGIIEVRFQGDTLWLSMKQIADLFERDKSVISKHLKNIFKEEELDRNSVVASLATTGSDKKTYKVDHYNLDAILSVGYRINSKKGTQFRQWANGVIIEHLKKGYSLNQSRFEQNARELEDALLLVQKTASSSDLTLDSGRGLIEIIGRYSQTFLLLQRFDEGLLSEPQGTPGGELPSINEASNIIRELKRDLLIRKDASELFGSERDHMFEGILGNLDQSAFREPAYPTIESKAAHLFYFVIKDHPFSDGNKRIASLLFLDFLRRNNRLFTGNEPVVNDVGLAALALLIAESAPRDKSIMIHLIMNMLVGAK